MIVDDAASRRQQLDLPSPDCMLQMENDVLAKRTRNWPLAVVFDLDGTLVDSSGDLTTSLNELLAERQLAPFSRMETIGFVGGGIALLVERALRTRKLDPSPEELLAAVDRYKTVYSGRLTESTHLYDGALDVLDALKVRGVRTAVCTNKTEALARGIIGGLGFNGRIDVIVGGKPDRALKPSPAPLLDALSQLGVKADDAIMVGDSSADVKCAKAANVRSICVSFGFSSIPVRELGADAVIDSYAGFDDACQTLRVATA
jgi:phosphoglycolate phosphatase